MLKIRKKVAVFVLVIIMTVGMICCSIIFKSVQLFDESDYDNYEDEYIEENINDEQNYKEQIEAFEKKVNKDDENDVYKLISLKSSWHYSYLHGSYFKEYKISDLSFKSDILNELCNCYFDMLYEEYFSEQGVESALYKETKKHYDMLDGIVRTGEYKDYIEYDNKRISESDFEEVQKKYLIECNNALLKICPTGEYNSIDEKDNARNLLSQKAKLETSLELDYDMETGGNITEERREELELLLDVVNKRIEQSILVGSTSEQIQGSSYTVSFGLGSLFTLVILIIVAGAMMSGETSTGTIKSLIIAPVRRWKIYTAKYLSLIVTIVVLTLYTYITSALINGLLFGFSSFGTEVYIVFGKVITMNFLAAQFLSAILSMVSSIVVVTFAYMLSIVTKNTAAAVAITMGVSLGGSTMHMMLMEIFSGREYITKFFPFNNVEWFDLIFETGSNFGMDSFMEEVFIKSPSTLPFAVIYVTVLLICMNWIGLDSFCKKDIK